MDTRKGEEVESVLTARELGDELGLKHIEVIRRIRKGQIAATKLGWMYTIEVSEIDRVRNSDWYQKLMERRQRESQSYA
jgi:hypothetical protein